MINISLNRLDSFKFQILWSFTAKCISNKNNYQFFVILSNKNANNINIIKKKVNSTPLKYRKFEITIFIN